jgi:hypothetical protein
MASFTWRTLRDGVDVTVMLLGTAALIAFSTFFYT